MPYTAQPGEGAAINLYYLFLGHVARWAGLGLAFTLNAARIVGAAALCAALYRLIVATPPERLRLWVFGLALFGSGVGWLAVLFGGFTSDFWVAEAYPFLAALANAHFPLGLALQIYLLTPVATPRPVAWALTSLALVMVYPFGWAVAVVVLLGTAALAQLWEQAARSRWQQAACVLVAGAPYALYTLWVVSTHPVLTGWSAQNLTPAMPLWDFVVSFSPALLLAVPGIYLAFKQRSINLGLFAVWGIACFVLLYMPFGLQRRLISGMYVPLTALAVVAAAHIFGSRLKLGLTALALLALPTNLLVLLGMAQAVQQQQPALYLQADELAAYAWLDEHAAPGALVLAPERNSLHLPAFADVRVWYGHPFETVQASQRQAEVQAFFEQPSGDWLTEWKVEYVLLNSASEFTNSIEGWGSVFSQNSIEILARHGQ
ncbi:MAG: hypothetical protein KIT08_09445 [Anaerolineales bacterium]|nr:MAG: hypothetical protein KIT08_09445 [Anaerolineales bacterium]